MKIKFLINIFLLIPIIVKPQVNPEDGNLTSQFYYNPESLKSESGIQWVEGISWAEIKAIAKKENKFIFIDCFATWCGPCKKMDEKVYTNAKVGQFAKKHFLSVKVQMDKTKYDNEVIKKWYTDANNIKAYFSLSAFPTYLFFSSNGVPLHKGVGYKDPKEFIELMMEALDSNKQYYKLLSDFKPGQMDTSEMKGLARSIKSADKTLAGMIAGDYLSRISMADLKQADNLHLMMEFNENKQIQSLAVNYLKSRFGSNLSLNDIELVSSFNNRSEVKNFSLQYLKELDLSSMSKQENIELLKVFSKENLVKEIANRYINSLPEEKLYTWENIQLLSTFTKGSKDRGFGIFYHQGAKINAIVSKQNFGPNAYVYKDYAERVVTSIINREEIAPVLKNVESDGKDIHWRVIFKSIRSKYTKQIAERVVVDAKVSLYQYFSKKYNKYWQEYIRYNTKKINMYGTDTTSGFVDAIVLNNFSWQIFLHGKHNKEFSEAIKWMTGVVRRNPENENHLDTYANLLYRIGEKEEAIKWEEKAMNLAIEKRIEYNSKVYGENVVKMKKGDPTWIVISSAK